MPTVKEDIFALGGMITFTFTGRSPRDFDFLDPVKLAEHLTQQSVHADIIALVISCFDEDQYKDQI